MARRDRVPRHKSHTHKRNTNAKLSPFQREQKRAKMANQVPTAAAIGSLDSIPHSQRRLFEYLQEKRLRQQAKRAALEQEQGAQERPTTESSSDSYSSRQMPKEKQGIVEDGSTATAAVAAAASTEPAASASKKLEKQAKYISLNDELSASVGAVLLPLASHRGRSTVDSDGDGVSDGPRPVEEIIARKKERKHRRKQEARRTRIAAQLQAMEEELSEYAKTANGGGKRARRKKSKGGDEEQADTAGDVRERVNLAFERKLRSMKKEEEEAASQREAAAAAATEVHRQSGEGKARKRRRDASSDAGERANGNDNRGNDEGSDETAPQLQRKRITFDPDVDQRAAEASANRVEKCGAKRKPQDFYELVDVVRYGERVEAPPVFDVVPNRNAAVSRLANALEREGRRNHGGDGAAERHRLLAGGGQLAQQKRLARLGLAPAITHTTRTDGTEARLSKKEEIKALRDRVMATYQRNRRKEVVERKGVDMKHTFPIFA
ncbi:hypothetical protein GH5_07838 [Leishmania sp. Ghana 2012 LV757]|uniref:hypothetical protein n=1 Tax=Leishmania sp. Ghana 2012 LV757 TaxID=2803181 RepID=UPI001B56E596|nr:hypothetical protein GH5_07838 [Leishmania sp. Ghana 2012 LV757]